MTLKNNTYYLFSGASRQLAHSRCELSIKQNNKMNENLLESHTPVLSLVRVHINIFKAMIDHLQKSRRGSTNKLSLTKKD